MIQIRSSQIAALQRAQEGELRKMLRRYCATALQSPDPQALTVQTLEIAREHGIDTLEGQELIAEILAVLGPAVAASGSWLRTILAQPSASVEETLEALRIQFELERPV